MKKFLTAVMLTGSFIALHAFTINNGHQNEIAASADTMDLREYAGIYKYFNSPVPSVQISYKAEKLFASAEGFQESQLYRQSKDVFVDSVYNAIFSFKRRENKIDTLLVIAGGAELLAVKEK